MQADNFNIMVSKNFSTNHMNPKGVSCKNRGVHLTHAERKRKEEMGKEVCLREQLCCVFKRQAGILT